MSEWLIMGWIFFIVAKLCFISHEISKEKYPMWEGLIFAILAIVCFAGFFAEEILN